MPERIKINYWIILFMVLVVFAGHSQIVITPRIPQKISHALDSLYPGEKEIEWSKRRRIYTADFFYNNLSVSLTLDRDAQVIKCIEEIEVDKLPEKIAPMILKECEGYKILFILSKYNRGRVSYELEIMKGRLLYIIDFNGMGYVIDKSRIEKETVYPIYIN